MVKKDLPQRKNIRLKEWDYAKSGVYFVTVCVANKMPLLREKTRSVGADIIRPQEQLLTHYGSLVEEAILNIPLHYENVHVRKYCIMSDHVHLLLEITPNNAKNMLNGRIISAPTLFNIVGSMKRWVSKQVGFSIWQKSFYDKIIRDEKHYLEICKYMDENPLQIRK